jgi:hypothetical protein
MSMSAPRRTDAGVLVADRRGELAAVMTQTPEPVPPRRLADPSLELVEIEQRLSSAGGVHDLPERPPDPSRARRIVIDLFKIELRKRAQVPDDPLRLHRRIGQDLAEDRLLRIRNTLLDQPFKMTKLHAQALDGNRPRDRSVSVADASACVGGRQKRGGGEFTEREIMCCLPTSPAAWNEFIAAEPPNVRILIEPVPCSRGRSRSAIQGSAPPPSSESCGSRANAPCVPQLPGGGDRLEQPDHQARRRDSVHRSVRGRQHPAHEKTRCFLPEGLAVRPLNESATAVMAALARKLAVILHRLLIDGTTLRLDLGGRHHGDSPMSRVSGSHTSAGSCGWRWSRPPSSRRFSSWKVQLEHLRPRAGDASGVTGLPSLRGRH